MELNINLELIKMKNKTKKIVINACYGGFGLSPLATKELAKRRGRDCYFFSHDIRTGQYTPMTLEEAEEKDWWVAYSVSNPQDYRLDQPDEDGLYKTANERYRAIAIDSRPFDRCAPDLVDVVESLGEKANGRHARLKIIEIPDDVNWEIDEYDGYEHVAEVHRTWN